MPSSRETWDDRGRDVRAHERRGPADAACVPLVEMASIAAQYEKPEDLYAADGIHPSEAGSLLIANRIASLVENLLASR